MNQVRPSLNVIVTSMTHIYLRKVTVVTSVIYNINNTNIKKLSDKSIQLSDFKQNYKMTET